MELCLSMSLMMLALFSAMTFAVESVRLSGSKKN